MHNVVCFAVGSYLNDWKDCIITQKRYCEKHGYKYHLIDQPYGTLHPKWQKFAYVKDLLRESDGNVLLIDADAEITPIAPAFNALVSEYPESDIFCVNGKSNRPNSGLIVFRNSMSSCAWEFLSTCIEGRNKAIPAEDFVTEEGENGHFIHFLRQREFKDKLHILDRAWNNTVPPPRECDFVIHYSAGVMRSHRQALLRKSRTSQRGG